MHWSLRLAIMFFTLLLAALLQDLIPVSQWLPAKCPLLMAVAIYTILHHSSGIALAGAVWAGGLTDVLGQLPPLCTSTYLLLAYLAIQMLQQIIRLNGILQGILLTAVLAMLHPLWVAFWHHSAVPLTFLTLGEQMIHALRTGCVAGIIGIGLCRWIDHLAGLVQPKKEHHDVAWETDS